MNAIDSINYQIINGTKGYELPEKNERIMFDVICSEFLVIRFDWSCLDVFQFDQ